MAEKPIQVGVDATTWWNDRGFGRFTRELMTALIARESSGFRYTLVTDHEPESPLPQGARVLAVSAGRTLNESAVGKSSRSPDYLLRLGAAVRRASFDVFFYPAVYSYFPMLARVPCVICYHDTTAERFPKLLFPTRLNHRLWQAKTMLARMQTTRAMTISKASARDLEEILHFPRSKIDVVTEAADPIFQKISDPARLSAARARHNIPSDASLLVYVGGMNPHKNLIGMLKAMPEIVARRPDVQLAIVGDTSGKGFWDDVPGLKAFVAANPPLSEHVRFTGYMSDAHLVDLLGSTSALVFPSLWEGFGLPAVEAMACGVPVLASDRSSLPEVVGDAGLLFDPEMPTSISSCVLRFLNDPELRARLAERALARASTFTWSRAAELAELSFARCHSAKR